MDFIRTVCKVPRGPRREQVGMEGSGKGSLMSRGVHRLAELGWRGMDKGSRKINWNRQMAVKNKGEKVGGNRVVLGQVVCLPEETGPDFTGSVCEVADARSRPLFHEGFLTVVWGGKERSWQSRWAECEPRKGCQRAFGDRFSRTW